MQEIPYDQFRTKVQATSLENKYPSRVMFELTYKCNFRCQHCYLPESHLSGSLGEPLSTEEIFSIIDELAEMGVIYLGFTGGEIFVRKDIFKILWHAKRRGFQIMLSTNGSYINELVADELAKLGPNKVDITLHSLKKDSFIAITQVENSFDKVSRAVQLLHERKVPLGLRANILTFNKDDVPEVAHYSDEIGAFFRMDGELNPRWNGDLKPYDFEVTLEEVIKTTDACYPKKTKEVVSTKSSGFDTLGPPIHSEEGVNKGRTSQFLCGVGSKNLAITPYGEIKPCVQLESPKFSIRKHTLKGAWEKLRQHFEDYKPDEHYECDTCEYADYCKWCPAVSHMEVGSTSKCSRRSLFRAKAKKEILEKLIPVG